MLLTLLFGCKDLSEEIKGLEKLKPEIVKVEPEPDTKNISPKQLFKITFSLPIDVETIIDNITLSAIDSVKNVPISFSANTDSKTISITPDEDLQFEWYYVMNIKSDVLSQDGKPLKKGLSVSYKTIYERRYELKSTWGSSHAGAFGTIGSIDIDSNGNIVVVDSSTSKIRILNQSDGTLIREWGFQGEGAGTYNPLGLCLDSKDNVYVTDTMGDRIVKYDHTGTYLSSTSSLDDYGTPLYGPIRVKSYSTGADEYLLAVGAAHPVYVYDLTNEVLVQTIEIGSTLDDDVIRSPFDIAMDTNKNLYISDEYGYYDNQNESFVPSVKKYSIDGTFLDLKYFKIVFNEESSAYYFFTALDINGTGTLVGTINQLENIMPKLVSFDTDLNIIGSTGTNDTNVMISAAMGIAYDDDDTVYISDTDNTRILKYDISSSNTTYETAWEKVYNYSLLGPSSIAVHKSDSIEYVYCADYVNSQIRMYDYNGNWLKTYNNFSIPTLVETDSEGNLFVIDIDMSNTSQNNSLTKMDKDGNIIGTSSIGSNLGLSYIVNLNQADITSQDTLILSDTYNMTFLFYDNNLNLINMYDKSWSESNGIKTISSFASVDIQSDEGLSFDALFIVDPEANMLRLFVETENGLYNYENIDGKQLNPFGGFENVTNIMYDKNNSLFTYEVLNRAIHWLDDQGAEIKVINENPLLVYDMTCKGEENIYVLSQLENMIYRFNLYGDNAN